MEEIISTLTEAIVLQKERIDDIQSTIDLLSQETKLNQDEIIKVKETLSKQIEDTIIQTQKIIDKAISNIKIETPTVDYLRIETSIKAKINRLLESKDSDITELKTDLKDFVIANLARFKPKDGKDADNDLIIRELKAFINENKADFKGDKGKDAEPGKPGADGVGIEDITTNNTQIIITLTNGVIKKFNLPKQIIRSLGGGGSNSDLDLNNIAETTLEDGDYMLINRGGVMFKVSLDNLLIDGGNA